MKKYLLLLILFVTSFSCIKAENTEQSEKWKLKYSYSNLENFDTYFPSVSLEYKNDYTLIYTNEWEKNNHNNSSNLIEFYKNDYYLFLGQSEYAKIIIGMEYYLKSLTFGLKLNKYEDTQVMFYKIQRDFYFKNGIIASGRINLVDGDKTDWNYMGKLNYKFFNYSYYFDFDNLNKGVAELKFEELENLFDLTLGYGREFNTNKDGFSLSFAVRF